MHLAVSLGSFSPSTHLCQHDLISPRSSFYLFPWAHLGQHDLSQYVFFCAQAISLNPACELQLVDLHAVGLGPEGVEELCHVLDKNTRLQTVVVSGNAVCAEAAIAMYYAARRKPKFPPLKIVGVDMVKAWALVVETEQELHRQGKVWNAGRFSKWLKDMQKEKEMPEFDLGNYWKAFWVAFCMGSHERLGSQSHVSLLDGNLIWLILKH